MSPLCWEAFEKDDSQKEPLLSTDTERDSPVSCWGRRREERGGGGGWGGRGEEGKERLERRGRWERKGGEVGTYDGRRGTLSARLYY